jgi:hypothetical protein
MLTILFIVGRTTLFTPVDINLKQVVDFLNFYACSIRYGKPLRYSVNTIAKKRSDLVTKLICIQSGKCSGP